MFHQIYVTDLGGCGKNGIAGREREQVKIITNLFKKCNTNAQKPIQIQPTITLFTFGEIGNPSSMRNNKIAGIDNLHAEYIQYGPYDIQQRTADLLRSIAETGE